MLAEPLTDYPSLFKTYTQPQSPELFNFCDLIAAYAEDPAREALVWVNESGEDRRFTFAEVDAESRRIADVLKAAGIAKGDRVLVMLPRIPEWQFTMLAIFRLGAIAIPCLTMQQPKDLEYRINLTDPKAVVAQKGDTEKFDGLLANDRLRFFVDYGAGSAAGGWENLQTLAAPMKGECPAEPMRRDEGCILYFTSGSTGLPKAVLHSSHFAYAFQEVAAYWLDLNEQSKDDTVWCTADTGWSLCATGTLIGPWLAGMRVLFYDGPFDAAKRLEIIERYEVTVFLAAATEYRHLILADIEHRDLSRLRLSATAGESLDAPTLRSWMDRAGCRLHEAYGQTECFMTVGNFQATEIRPGSMGLPFPGSSVNVISPHTHELSFPDEIGLVAIRMPTNNLMLGYWGAPEKTKERFVTNALGETWFVTGDQAKRDQDGYLWYAGRDDDIINTAGYRVGPAEVESVVQDHPAVRECAAVASPDVERGVVIKVFAILNEGYTASDDLVGEIKSFVKVRTAPYKYPRKIEFVAELPMTPTGKIRRDVLRQREAEANAGAV